MRACKRLNFSQSATLVIIVRKEKSFAFAQVVTHLIKIGLHNLEPHTPLTIHDSQLTFAQVVMHPIKVGLHNLEPHTPLTIHDSRLAFAQVVTHLIKIGLHNLEPHARLTIHDSQFTIHNSQLTTHHSRFTIHDSRSKWHQSINRAPTASRTYSQLTTHHSQLTIHDHSSRRYVVAFQYIIPYIPLHILQHTTLPAVTVGKRLLVAHLKTKNQFR